MTERTYPQGVPCWIDTGQSDVEAAAEFYLGLFGWTFEDVTRPGVPGRHLIAKLNGQDVGGLASTQGGAAVWSTYIAVEDADVAVQRSVAAGAAVRSAPADAGEGDGSAVLTDAGDWAPRSSAKTKPSGRLQY
ncbi:putative enzyme related to lactoylglutathione lyase [Arthrobacter sp. PvP023]|uniref:VOC family protein n=1 Tax=Micrococcaceae TaxID=1268 RepID=UPI001B62505D|nr:VOC family protein [Arthrobacter sp. PvP023]MBP1135985.1 putative enzyme related to lactoylglutathione lyase [Arthrobacter sp. PvP023]